MGNHRRYTIKELQEFSNKELILRIIMERHSFCTNPYSPLSQRLEKLWKWAEQNIKE